LDISAGPFYRLSGQLWSGGRRRVGNDPQAGMYEVTGTGMILGWSQMTIASSSRLRPKRGFTLIELLVVIAIIAILMSILIPAMSRAQKQARAVVCQSNLKQWGAIWVMYTDDNNGNFPTRMSDTGRWINVLYNYYYKNPKMRVCPMVKKRALEVSGSGDLTIMGGDALTSWGMVDIGRGAAAGTYGSYGCNGWVYVPGQDPLYGMSAVDFWKTPNLNGASNIPLFLDAWFWDGWPLNGNNPPAGDGREYRATGDNDAMNRFCINRHQQGINGIFLDYHIRKIWLKGLWRLKWHKTFKTDATVDWSKASWMANFKED
jgi:prepilin-type N-terminal cleavage/methylation domain-containing protein